MDFNCSISALFSTQFCLINIGPFSFDLDYLQNAVGDDVG